MFCFQTNYEFLHLYKLNHQHDLFIKKNNTKLFETNVSYLKDLTIIMLRNTFNAF